MKLQLILAMSFLISSSLFAARVGDQNRENYMDVYRETSNEHIKNLIENTVLINPENFQGRHSRGTGFYIGRHKGLPLFVTNWHVMSKDQCSETTISFMKKNSGQKDVKCDKVLFSYGKSDGSDITVFTIKEDDADKMLGEGLEIDWEAELIPGMELAQTGFGDRSNPLQERRGNDRSTQFSMRVSKDADCVVVTPKNATYEFPEQNVNHTFLHGCDTITGDSGSALMDRSTGKVIGLVWGAGNKKVKSDKLWDDMVGQKPDADTAKRTNWAIRLKNVKSYFDPYLN